MMTCFAVVISLTLVLLACDVACLRHDHQKSTMSGDRLNAANLLRHDLSPSREDDDTSSVVHQLMDHLFSCYHKAASLELPVVVHIEVLLIKVKGTVEREGIFESVVAIFIKWHDSRLKWNPLEYGNITALSLDAEEVGLPDIAMTNSADNLYSITRNSKFIVRLSYDGYLKYVPTGTARTFCDLKLLSFPFDVQKCSLEFESWSLDNESLTFDMDSVLHFDDSFTSQLWTICKLESVTYNYMYFTNETFSRVRFDITVVRKSTFFIVNLIFPCTTLSMIQLLVFLLSSIDTTADRIGFGTTNLLTLVVFQTIVTEELPKTSDAVTSLSKYIIALIVTSAVGIFESVLVERMMTIRRRPPPKLVYRFFKPMPILWRELPEIGQKMEKVNKIHKLRRSRRSRRQSLTTSISESSLPLFATSVDFQVNNKHDENDTADECVDSGVAFQSNKENGVGADDFDISTGAPRTRAYSNGSYYTNGYGTNLQRVPHYYSRSACLRIYRNKAKFDDNIEEGGINNINSKIIGHDPSSSERMKNAYQWMELAYKVDALAFLICFLLSIMIPVALFAPPIYYGSRCETVDLPY